MKPKRSLRYRLDKYSVYIPALTMAVLALVTFWMAHNAPSFVQDEAQKVISPDPDYSFNNFVIRNYAKDGQLTLEIHGKEGRHFPLKDELEVDHIRVRSVAQTGRVTTARADVGASNGAATEMSLRGNATVVQEAFEGAPRLEFQGEELKVWTQEERVQSDLPVTLIRGNDRITGNNLRYDKRSQTVEITGRVRGSLQPGTVQLGR